MIIYPNCLLYKTDKTLKDLNATFVGISTNFLLETHNSVLCNHKLDGSNYPFYR